MKPDKYREALGFNKEELKKFLRMKARKEIIMTKVAKPSLLAPETRKQEKEVLPSEISMDDFGRIRSKEGHLMSLKSKATSAAVNENLKKKEKKVNRGYGVSELKETSIYDPILKLGKLHEREKLKSFSFHFFDEKDEDQTVAVKYYDPIPGVEWWDSALLPPKSKNYLFFAPESMTQTRKGEENKDELLKNILELEKVEITETHFRKVFELIQGKIHSMIEHPIPFKTLVADSGTVTLPMYLTVQERKKLKRMKKAEKLKETREKQMLGLIKPPEPKVKLSNMMRILGDEAVVGPSQTEEQVKKQISERLRVHLEQNEKRKLTKEGKADKVLRRLKRDAARETRIAVFRIPQIISPKHKFKLDKNAQQLSITGVCLISSPNLKCPSMIIVEGGLRAIKMYKKLVLRRIKWEFSLDEMATMKSVTASLVWEAAIKERGFKKWNVIEMKSELDGKRLLEERRMVNEITQENTWDLVMKFN